MGMAEVRDWVNSNQATVMTGAGVLALVAVAVMISQCRGGPQKNEWGVRQAYFYDATTKKVFIDDETKISPITSPDGNEAYRAHLFTCGNCTEEERFIGYLEMYPAEAKELIENNRGTDEAEQAAYEQRMLAAAPKDGGALQWVSALSDEGAQLLAVKCESGALAKYCDATP